MLLQRQTSFEADLDVIERGRGAAGRKSSAGDPHHLRKTSSAGGSSTNRITLPPIQDRRQPKKRAVKRGCARIKESLKHLYRKFGLRHFVPMLIVIVYNLLGAALFLVIERADDRRRVGEAYADYQRARTTMAKKMTEIAEDSVEDDQRERIIWEAIGWYEHHLNFTQANHTVWDFWNSMFFAGTVYTTIGYGNIFCKTRVGQLATMLYALGGIPLMLVALTDLGKWFYKTLYMLVLYVERKRRNRVVRQRVEEKKVQRKLTLHQLALNAASISGGSVEQATPDTPEGAKPSVTFTAAFHKTASLPSQKSLDSHRSVELPAITIAIPATVGGGSTSGASLASFQSIGPAGVGSQGERISNAAADAPPLDSPNDDDLKELVLDELEVETAGGKGGARVPVWLAVGFTVAWIFACAAIFCTWENWSYFTSVYFFVISLTTIGLGDITPDYPQYMVLAYLLVIAGLALVTMCINVVQKALEDLFMQLLMKVLMEYQKRMAAGGDQVDATMGMMTKFANSPTTKYLMPLLSKGNTTTMVQRFQEQAKAQGIEVPPILSKIDMNTGLPAILTIDSNEDEYMEPTLAQTVENAIVTAHTEAQEEAAAKLSVVPAEPMVVYYNAHSQTDVTPTDEHQQQTTAPDEADAGAQTALSSWNTVETPAQTTAIEVDPAETQTPVVQLTEETMQTTQLTYEEALVQTLHTYAGMVEADMQTVAKDLAVAEMQTVPPQTSEEQMQTVETSTVDADAQTPTPSTGDREQQTIVAETSTHETQYDAVTTKNERIQTPTPEMHDVEIQAELNPADSTATKKSKTLDNARKKLKQALGMKSKSRRAFDNDPEMSSWKETSSDASDEQTTSGSEEDDDSESRRKKELDWNRVDGLHAEKQKPVSDLTRMFERRTSTPHVGANLPTQPAGLHRHSTASRFNRSSLSMHQPSPPPRVGVRPTDIVHQVCCLFGCVDGLHAEKQKPVSDLTRMFERRTSTPHVGATLPTQPAGLRRHSTASKFNRSSLSMHQPSPPDRVGVRPTDVVHQACCLIGCVDGLHAEKQKPVSDLTRMFERRTSTPHVGATLPTQPAGLRRHSTASKFNRSSLSMHQPSPPDRVGVRPTDVVHQVCCLIGCVDGLHAEKQKPVSDPTRMFERRTSTPHVGATLPTQPAGLHRHSTASRFNRSSLSMHQPSPPPRVGVRPTDVVHQVCCLFGCVDGLHAEKQKPVSDLTRMFERRTSTPHVGATLPTQPAGLRWHSTASKFNRSSLSMHQPSPPDRVGVRPTDVVHQACCLIGCVDGLHAEKQKPVSDPTRMFERRTSTPHVGATLPTQPAGLHRHSTASRFNRSSLSMHQPSPPDRVGVRPTDVVHQAKLARGATVAEGGGGRQKSTTPTAPRRLASSVVAPTITVPLDASLGGEHVVVEEEGEDEQGAKSDDNDSAKTG